MQKLPVIILSAAVLLTEALLSKGSNIPRLDISYEGQELAGKHYFRPRPEKAAAKYAKNFSPLKFVNMDGKFGGWQKAQTSFFDDDGTFDQIHSNAK